MEDDILHGKLLNQSMARFSFFDIRIISLVRVAEEVNQLENIFSKLNTQYNNHPLSYGKCNFVFTDYFKLDRRSFAQLVRQEESAHNTSTYDTSKVWYIQIAYNLGE
ncbi:MAG: hypothetical protein Q8928_10390 [Bacteroidota bacterium]|nr:hypothetical protein [Bacteroidota bacterium]